MRLMFRPRTIRRALELGAIPADRTDSPIPTLDAEDPRVLATTE